METANRRPGAQRAAMPRSLSSSKSATHSRGSACSRRISRATAGALPDVAGYTSALPRLKDEASPRDGSLGWVGFVWGGVEMVVATIS